MSPRHSLTLRSSMASLGTSSAAVSSVGPDIGHQFLSKLGLDKLSRIPEVGLDVVARLESSASVETCTVRVLTWSKHFWPPETSRANPSGTPHQCPSLSAVTRIARERMLGEHIQVEDLLSS